MEYELCDRAWFQLLERLPRPVLRAGLAIIALAYAARPLFELTFQIEVFGALAAAAGITYISRAVEKYKETKADKLAAVEAVRVAPNGKPDSAFKPDLPPGEEA